MLQQLCSWPGLSNASLTSAELHQLPWGPGPSFNNSKPHAHIPHTLIPHSQLLLQAPQAQPSHRSGPCARSSGPAGGREPKSHLDCEAFHEWLWGFMRGNRNMQLLQVVCKATRLHYRTTVSLPSCSNGRPVLRSSCLHWSLQACSSFYVSGRHQRAAHLLPRTHNKLSTNTATAAAAVCIAYQGSFNSKLSPRGRKACCV